MGTKIPQVSNMVIMMEKLVPGKMLFDTVTAPADWMQMPSVTAREKLDFCVVNLVLDSKKSRIKRTWMRVTKI